MLCECRRTFLVAIVKSRHWLFYDLLLYDLLSPCSRDRERIWENKAQAQRASGMDVDKWWKSPRRSARERVSPASKKPY